jgi:DNA replication protein DnaC
VAVPRAISVAQQLAPLEQFPVVLITGGAGRGKTSLGTAILRWHIDRGEAPGATEEEQVWGQRVLWTSAEAVATSWRNKTARLLERAHAASVLLLDDLGQEPPAEQSDLTALLRARHADCRPTIATWGFALAELSRYGASIERRFTDAQAARLDLGAARAS